MQSTGGASIGIGIGHWQHFHILTAVASAKVVGNILTNHEPLATNN